MPNGPMWVARNAKARPTAIPIAVWLATSNRSEGLINADRLLMATVLDLRHVLDGWVRARAESALAPTKILVGWKRAPLHAALFFASMTSGPRGHRTLIVVCRASWQSDITGCVISIAVTELLADGGAGPSLWCSDVQKPPRLA